MGRFHSTQLGRLVLGREDKTNVVVGKLAYLGCVAYCGFKLFIRIFTLQLCQIDKYV